MGTFDPAAAKDLPVLITAFSRYDSTREVFLALQKIRPDRVYFACDGPRTEEEAVTCGRVRSLVELIDWECKVQTLFHERNLGCKSAMVANIDWFFSHEEEGVILEDDIVPDPTFFRFCKELLEKYRDDDRVWAIIGNNLSATEVPDDRASYWFSKHGYGAYWGWASWRRSWRLFDADMKDWPQVARSKKFHDFFLTAAEREEVCKLFEHTHSGRISTAWDYQFDYAKIKAGAANIIAQANLCLNIGFNEQGTHTTSTWDSRNKGVLQQARFPLVHPSSMKVDPARDLAYFNAHVLPSRFKRIKSKIKEFLPEPIAEGAAKALGRIRKRIGFDRGHEPDRT